MVEERNNMTTTLNVVGKTKAEAIQILNDAGVSFRIMQDEEQSFAGTCDWRPERLNLTIKDGLVTVQRNG